MKHILIAGGTGLIGHALTKRLMDDGHQVKLLTRHPTAENHVFWNPASREIDTIDLEKTQVLVNLTGAPLDEKRWTAKRRRILESSRIGTTNFLFQNIDKFPQLEQFVSASGITAYGFDNGLKAHPETDAYGNDYLSQLVKDWEAAADQFSEKAIVSKLRIAVVFSPNGGALTKIATPIRYYVGSPLGSGKQIMPWVHIDDLVEQFHLIISKQWGGVFNSNTSNDSNETITRAIAKALKRPIVLPNVPAFLLKLIFGALSEMILKGSAADNSKLKEKGYQPKYDTLEKALKNCL